MDEITLTARFEEGLGYAAHLHARQKRKGTAVPYVAHLLSVAALVLENGGDEDQAIAALLHDAVEDQGGIPTLKEIRKRFGERVAHIVDGCSDAYVIPKPPWRKRKEEYLAHLRVADADIRLVSLADKLHNARSILRDLRQDGPGSLSRFNGGRDGTLWYYHSLVSIFQETDDSLMVSELTEVVAEIDRIASYPAKR
ncbi:MAG: HD domain-containing protein [Anaerolineales bacterium]|jgi:(p)ppGpp synthase/HD superfamily hydrolase